MTFMASPGTTLPVNTVTGLKSHKIKLLSRIGNESTNYEISGKGMFDVYQKTLYQSTLAKYTRHRLYLSYPSVH
jgi:hypothetical protein